MEFHNTGKVIQVLGAIVDVQFNDVIPGILSALQCKIDERKLVLEVSQHIGDGVVRCIAMDSTNGLARGVEVTDTGKTIEVPVGRCTLGRIFNVIGETIDNRGPVKNAKDFRSIHATPPSLVEQSTNTEILATGTLSEGWEDRIIWWCWSWKNSSNNGAD